MRSARSSTVGGLPTEAPWTWTPLDRDPPLTETLWTEISLYREPLDIDPPWIETSWTETLLDRDFPEGT